ncbi:hypothetical protein niasHT_010333 [Heterodera trifolii]|uniref:Uncharacterized protein n=1 Tax=Heterodera trifolii TaxID=157864 RepID=A0ABD2M791_9BILA
MDLRRQFILQRWDLFLTTIASDDSNQTKTSPVPFPIDSATLDRLKDEKMREQLAQSLLDGTVHSIVDSLKDLQTIQEQHLWAQREEKLPQLNCDGISDEEERQTNEDKAILERIDQIAHEQQSTLICAGLPLFKCSDDASDLRIQMALIQFILSLGPIYRD